MPEKGWVICNVLRDWDRLLQLSIFNAAFPESASHQPVLITSLPFVHTARRAYRLSASVIYSEVDLFSFAEDVFRSLLNHITRRKERSRNKVSVGEPASCVYKTRLVVNPRSLRCGSPFQLKSEFSPPSLFSFASLSQQALP